MTCDIIRNRLLALEDPAKPAEGIAVHLTTCSACRSWYRILVHVETIAGHLDVPEPIYGPSTVMDRLRAEKIPQSRGSEKAPNPQRQEISEPVPTEKKAPTSRPQSADSKKPQAPKNNEKSHGSPLTEIEGFPSGLVLRDPGDTIKPSIPETEKTLPSFSERITKFWPVGIAAALIMGGAILYVSTTKKADPNALVLPEDQLLASAIQTKIQVDLANTPSERLKLLQQLAKYLHEEAKVLSKVAPTEMESIAKMYGSLVRDGFIEQANQLSPAERRTLLKDCLELLNETEQEANRLATESPPGADTALRDIAAAARDGKTRITRIRG